MLIENYEQFKKHMAVYEAFENSSIGHLIKDGSMHLVLSTDSDELVSSNHPIVRKYISHPISKYGTVSGIINEVLNALPEDVRTLNKQTGEPVVIQDLNYAFLVYHLEQDTGVETLTFGTMYNTHEIFNLRFRYPEPSSTVL